MLNTQVGATITKTPFIEKSVVLSFMYKPTLHVRVDATVEATNLHLISENEVKFFKQSLLTKAHFG